MVTCTTGGIHEAHAVQDISDSISGDEQQLLQARSARLVLSRSFFNCTALTAEGVGSCTTRDAAAIADCGADFNASYTYCLQAITLQKVAGSRVTTSEIEEHAAARAQPLIRLWAGLMAAAFPPLSAYYKEAQSNAHTKALVYMALDAVSTIVHVSTHVLSVQLKCCRCSCMHVHLSMHIYACSLAQLESLKQRCFYRMPNLVR